MLRRGGDIATAREDLRRSIQVDPSYAPAWAALAGSYVAAGDHDDEAIRAAETAHQLLPARTDVTANLLRLYLAAGRRDEGVSLAERAFAGDPDQLRMASRVIARSDVDRARRLVEDGRYDDALAALAQAEAVHARIPDDAGAPSHRCAAVPHVEDQRMSARWRGGRGSNEGEIEHAASC
jgi:tetratricopeptide (TPR) repeat protein